MAQPDELFATRDGIQGAHFIDKYGHIHYLDRHTLECALSRYGHTEEVAWRRTTILHDGWKTPFLIHFKKHTPKRLSRVSTISRQGGAETHPSGCLFCMAKSENTVCFLQTAPPTPLCGLQRMGLRPRREGDRSHPQVPQQVHGHGHVQ